MMTSLFFQAKSLGKSWFSFSKPPLEEIISEKENDDDDGEIEMVHASWDKLPCDIWSLIFQRLPLVDRIHASLVCKEWRSSVLKQTLQPVWMLLFSDCLNNDCDHRLSFFDLSEGEIGKLKLHKSAAAGASIFGASKGWLALTKGTENNLQPFLLDPISGIEIPLPPLSTIMPSNEKGAEIFDQIEISSKDASQSVVAASFGGKTLALCRPKDKKWTIFEGLADNYCFATVKFCDGILYAFIYTEFDEATFQFQTHSMKLAAGDDDDVILQLIPPASFYEIDPPTILEHPLKEVDLFAKNWMAIAYMVESNGELLIVIKILDLLRAEDYTEEIDINNLPLFSYFRVARFEVLKVEASDTLSVTRLSNLDDQTLFIDGKDSHSIADENFSKNCIYFLEDSLSYDAFGWKPNIISRESGVFHLDDGRIERWLPSLDIVKGFHNRWFFPNIKIGDFN
ncbi:hypothetical protein CRYUN_Cryun18bG0127300 [Craigia yunnanensis]